MALVLATAPAAALDGGLFDVPDGGASGVVALAMAAFRDPAQPTLRRGALEAGSLDGNGPTTLADRVLRVAVRVQLGLDGGDDAAALRLWCAQHPDAPLCSRVIPWLDALRPQPRLPGGEVALTRREQKGACEALWYLDLGALPEAERAASLTLRDVNLPTLGTVWRRLEASDERITQARTAAAKSPTAWWAAFHGLLAVGRWDEARALYALARPPPPGPLHAAYAPALHALLLALHGQLKEAVAENSRVNLRLPAAPAGLFLAASYYVDGLRLRAAGHPAARAAFKRAREAIETHDPGHPLWELACSAEDAGTCRQVPPRDRRPQAIEVYACER
ncbi:MAG: hypothetical protein IT380_01695 [Myxococcales bacterium]|nr:hypothetical protein [Myxococcales bacterium]